MPSSWTGIMLASVMPSALAFLTSTTIIQDGVSIAIVLGDGIGTPSADASLMATVSSSGVMTSASIGSTVTTGSSALTGSSASIVSSARSASGISAQTTTSGVSFTSSGFPTSSMSTTFETVVLLTTLEPKSEVTAASSSLSASSTDIVITPPSISPARLHTHEVDVGKDGMLSFLPPSVNASVGDVVLFKFHSLNHSVIRSKADAPCEALEGGFNTGFNQYNAPDDGTNLVAFTVNTPEPRYFFCQQNDPISHCELGMVFALNAGMQAAASQTLTASASMSTSPLGTTVTALSTASTQDARADDRGR